MSWCKVKIIPSFIQRRIVHRPTLARIISNIGWLFFDKILRLSSGLVVGVWLARYLGPDQFGDLNYVMAFVAMFIAIAELGLASIVVRELTINPRDSSVILGSAALMQLIGACVGIMLIFFVITVLRPPNDSLRLLIVLYSLTLTFKATEVVRYWFESQVQSRYVVWVENIVFVSITIVKAWLIYGQASLQAFIWLSIVEAAMIAIALLSIYQLKTGELFGWRPQLKYVQHLIKQSWPLLLAGLSVTLYTRLDVIMLQEMANTREVGLYAAATKLSEVLYLIPVVIIASISPVLIKLQKSDNNEFLFLLRRLYFILSWAAISLSLVFSLFSDPLIHLIFGLDFVGAGPILAVHVWASLAVFLGVASSQYLLVNQLQKVALYRTLLGLICNAILNFFTIPTMGALGAAMSTLIAYFLATYALVFFSATRKHSLQLIIAPFLWPMRRA